MAFDNVKCFGCQQYGHIERDCPDKNYASELGDGDKPPWCGECDRESRLIFHLRDGVYCSRKCKACHPSGHLLPVQFKRCKECKSVIYEWNRKTECGQHPPIGIDLAAIVKAKVEAAAEAAKAKEKAK